MSHKLLGLAGSTLLALSALIVTTAAPAAAGEGFVEPTVDYRVCGDPRLFVAIDNPNRWPVTYRIGFLRGDGQRPRAFVKKVVAPHSVRRIGPRWVNAAKPVVIKRFDHESQAWVTVERFRPRPDPWGVRGCPADRFGWPIFGEGRIFTIAD